MKILFISNYFYPAKAWGGPVFALYSICNNLSQIAQNRLTVLTTDSMGPNAKAPVAFSAKPERMNDLYDVYYCRQNIGKFSSWEGIRKMRGLIKRHDLVHVTGCYTFNVLFGLFFTRLLGTPVVWSPRGAILATHEFKNARLKFPKIMFEKISRVLLGKRSMIHCTSSDETKIIQHVFPNIDTFEVSNGVEFCEILEKPSVEIQKFKLLFLSRLDTKKGLENLFVAMGKLPKEITLSICGEGVSGYQEQLENHVNQLGLSDRISFHGMVSGSDKRDKFAEADLFVLPSYSENFGNVIAESLMRGLPVIATKGTPWEEVVEEDCGMWVENDPESLMDAILKMREADLIAMGRRGHDWMVREFGWEKKTKEIFEAYQKLLGSQNTEVV